jgi:hypothetical protein
MVFGLGEGEIEITLGPSTFTPRETLNGKVKLRLPKAVAARAVSIEFYGEVLQGDKAARVFRSSQSLGGERTYKDGETFKFALPIPDSASPPEAQGTFGSVRDLFIAKPRNWYIEAKMDIPMSPDINTRISVYLRR